MGHKYFTSLTEAIQNEINFLKRSGNTYIDSALDYCVLVCLMMDFACKDSFGKNIHRVAHKSNDSSNNFKNINSSVIEYLYQSLYKKDIMITIDEIQEMCKKLTYTYMKQDLNSKLYIFRHQTVFEAVLYSYWHRNTMADVIKDFKADILAEHFRPFDSILKGFKKFLIVPEDRCTDLANKLFETFLANFYEFRKCHSLIQQSKFILTEFNLKLCKWCTKEENVHNFEYIIIFSVIKPFNYKEVNNKICGNVDDNYLIKRLIYELQNRASTVGRYIQMYASNEFRRNFNAKVLEWFQSEDNVINCNWDVIDYFIRPTFFTIKDGQIGTATTDCWLIQRLIILLMKSDDVRARSIERYIKEYGCEQFVNSFNRKLAEWFKSEEHVAICEWYVIDFCIRPKSFTIENGQIGIATNDCWLIQRLIIIMMKSDDIRVWSIERYIKEYGCEQFVNSINGKLAEWFKSEENVANCEWYMINSFIRPKSFTIENGQIGTATTDCWLIQRLIIILMKPDYFRARSIERYIRKYGREHFVNSFNGKLAEWFKSEENVANCNWDVIEYFIRPSSFTIENGQIGTATTDCWLIQRLIIIMMKYNYVGPWSIEIYIKEYGCEQFVNSFNRKLAEWFKSEEHVANCEWYVIDFCIRPKSFTIKNGQIGTATTDCWLIQRLIIIMIKSEDVIAWSIERYIEKYGCEQFVNSFNGKLAKWFKSEENVANCEWYMINYFIRPKSFTIANGQIGTATTDCWLIQRLINTLMKSESSKQRVGIMGIVAWTIYEYIMKYGCEQFANSFNEKLAEWFQSEKNVENCEWPVIEYFIRPTSFTFKNGQIGTVTNDCWLLQRLLNILMKQDSSQIRVINSTRNIERYIRTYGSEQFVNSFNEKLAECIHSEEDEIKWNLQLFTTFVRPRSWLGFEKIRINIQDERVIRYLFLKLEQPTNVYTVKLYIRNYGSDEFITHFNERLKEKVESGHEFYFECKWEYLELFFDDNDIDFEGFSIDNEDVSDIDLSISIGTSSQFEDCEADFNIDFDTSSSSEDSESDSTIDVDSNNHYEDIYNETNHRPSLNNGNTNGVLIMKE